MRYIRKQNQKTNLIQLFHPVLTTDPYHKFRIRICTEEFNRDEEDNGLACQLVFAYTEKYPDTAPLVEIEDPVEFKDDFERDLLEHINKTVSHCNNLSK